MSRTSRIAETPPFSPRKYCSAQNIWIYDSKQPLAPQLLAGRPDSDSCGARLDHGEIARDAIRAHVEWIRLLRFAICSSVSFEVLVIEFGVIRHQGSIVPLVPRRIGILSFGSAAGLSGVVPMRCEWLRELLFLRLFPKTALHLAAPNQLAHTG